LQNKARFFGKHEHALDLKGRVILPARFRAAFEHGGYLSQYTSRCLALWTPEEFEVQLEKMEQQQEAGRDELNMARYLAAGTVAVEVDRQGRFPIPAHMREYARLDTEVLVNGAINRVELWSPAVWSDKVQPAERALTDED
jgi:MraZ protein